MQAGQCNTHLAAMLDGRAAHPHAFEEGDQRRRPACELADHGAIFLMYGLRAADALGGQMLHQAKEKRQVGGVHPLLVERQDVGAGRGVEQEVRVLHALRDAFVGQQFADVVVGQECAEFDFRDVGVDGHGSDVPPEVAESCAADPTPLCPAGHLPLRGGDQTAARLSPSVSAANLPP